MQVTAVAVPEAAARQRYLEGEKKYKEFVETSKNIAARDREQFVKGAMRCELTLFSAVGDFLRSVSRAVQRLS
eukprot:3524819-Rhodomonas_salina.1